MCILSIHRIQCGEPMNIALIIEIYVCSLFSDKISKVDIYIHIELRLHRTPSQQQHVQYTGRYTERAQAIFSFFSIFILFFIFQLRLCRVSATGESTTH